MKKENKINWVSVQNLIGGMAIGFEQSFESQPIMIIHQGWKNDEHYIVQFNRNDDNINGNSILRVYKRSGVRMPISNPYGPAFVRYENHKIVETKYKKSFRTNGFIQR